MLTVNGLFSQPQMVCRTAHNHAMDSDIFKPRQVLAQNIAGLMGTREGPKTHTDLAAKSGVAQGTIGRILKCEVDARIDTVSNLAGAYGLEAWQLMVAGMNPTNPPVLMPVSEREKALYASLRAVAHEITQLDPPPYKTKPE